jgi:uncharacterized protein YbaR (Trm112 family)
MSTVRFGDEIILKMLVDPIDKSPLRMMGDVLQSTSGRTFPIIQGVPVMLVDGVDQTIRVAERTLNGVRQSECDPRSSLPTFFDWHLNPPSFGTARCSTPIPKCNY